MGGEREEEGKEESGEGGGCKGRCGEGGERKEEGGKGGGRKG